MKTAADTRENLCDTCEIHGYTSPDCGDDIDLVFGDGYGNDNVIGCSVFESMGAEPDSGWREGE